MLIYSGGGEIMVMHTTNKYDLLFVYHLDSFEPLVMAVQQGQENRSYYYYQNEPNGALVVEGWRWPCGVGSALRGVWRD